MNVWFRRWRAGARVVLALLVCTALAVPLHAQTPTTATLTQWDVFTATGGAADASQNIGAVFMDVSGIAGPAGSVWITTQVPKPRLGRLSPSLTNSNYVEWRPVNSPETGGAPLGLTLNSSNGDLWVATQGDPSLMMKVGNSNTFRKYRSTYPLTVQGIAVAVDHAAIVALPTKNASGIGDAIIKVPRASGEGTVTMQMWFVGGQPQQVALDNSGNIWYTARTTNKLARLNPGTALVTEWTIPAGTVPAGLHVSATRVCVVSAGTTGGVNGVAHCLNPGTNQFTRYSRAVGDGFDVPQRIAINSDSELFITEQRNSTMSFVANAAQAGAPVSTVTPTTRTVAPKSTTLNVTEATYTPTTYTVPSTDTALTGVDNGSGFVRFPLPRPTLAYPYAQDGFPQPLAITPVFNDSGRGTGTVFVGEYFNGPAAGRQAAATLARFAIGVAPVVKTIITNPSTLRFDATAGAAAPGSQAVAIEEATGQSLSWTASESASWLTIAPSSGSAPASLTVTADHASLAAGTYTTSITVDDGPGNAAAKTIEVTLNVTGQPALARSPATLSFAQSAGITPPAQTISITNTGAGILDWTATANQTWLHLGEASGTAPSSLSVQVDAQALSAGTHNGTVTITAPGAANSPLTVAVSVTVSNLNPITTLSATTFSFTATKGGAAPANQALTISNTGGGTLPWSTDDDGSWLEITPSSGSTVNGSPATVALSVDHSELTGGTHTATILIVDGTEVNAPKTVEVTLTLTAPTISLSATEIPLSAVKAAASPANQNVTISNTGDAPLNYTASVTSGNSWLSVAAGGSGSVAVAASGTLTLAFNTGSLAKGVHTGTVQVSDPNATNTPQTITVELTITAPTISASPTALVFSAQPSQDPASQTLTISNTGDATLTFTPSAGTTSGGSWLSVSPSGQSTVAPSANTVLTVSVASSSLSAGTYNGTITIADPSATNTPQVIPVALTIANVGVLDVSPTTITVAADKGGANPSNQTVTIGNTGATSFNYNASVTSGAWLSIVSGGNGAVAPAGSTSLVLAINIAGLAKGVHTGTVQVSAPGAGGSPQTITVNLTVRAPVISLSPSSLSYAVLRTRNPATQTITLSNTGDAVMSFTSAASTNSGGSWLAVSPTSGTVAAGGSTTLTVTVTSASMATGSYTGSVSVADANADNTPQAAAVSLAVNPAPTISLNAASRTFTVTQSLNPASQTVTVTNTGDGALTFTPSVTMNQGSGWLAVSPSGSTTVNAGASQVLTIDITSASLSPGVYTGSITIADPNASNTPQTVSVTLTVNAAPVISRSPATLTFSAKRTTNPATQSITLTNSGGATMNFTAAATTNGGGSWLAVSPTSGTLGAGASTTLTVTVTSSALSTGGYTGNIEIADPAAPNTPVNTPVSLTVNAAPTISLNAASRTFTVTETLNPASQTVTVTNTGDASLTFTPAVTMNNGSGWLAVSPSGSSTVAAGNNQVLTISITSAALAPGVYTGSIEIADTAATNSPQTVSVTLTVNAAPVISRSPATLTFSAKKTTNPATQSITLTNSGGATMNFTAGATTDGGGSWLAVSPTSGTLGAGQSATLTVTVTSAALAKGNYTGTITMSDPAAPNNPQTTAVSLAVTAPTITLNPTTLTFNTTTGNNPSSQTFQVGNTGDAELIFTPSVTMNNGAGWLAVSPSGQSTVNAGGSTTLSVNITSSALAAGTYTGSISIADAAATNTPQSVGITVVVTAPGILTVSPTTHNKTATKGGANPANFTSSISNTGSQAFTYSSVASSTGNWLSVVSGGSGTLNPTDSATLTMAIDISGLAKGNHVGTVTVTAPGATNSPTVITVNLTVQAGTISLNPTSIALGSRKFKQASPANQNVTISNTGDATLNYSASVTAGGTWLSIVSGGSGALAPSGGGTIALAFNTSTLASGSYTGTVTVTDPNSSNSPQTLDVTLTVTPAPFIVVTPGSLSYTTLVRWTVCNGTNTSPGTTTASQTFTLQNTGDATLNFTMTPATVSGGTWLSATAAGGATSVAAGGSLTITVAVTTNPVEGPLTTTTSRSGTLSVSDANASNTPGVVNVTFTPQAAAAKLCISPASTSGSRINLGSFVKSTSNNAAGSISVQNVGDASFTWTSTQSTSRGTINRSPASGTVAANSSTTVNLTLTTTTHTGAQTGQVTISTTPAAAGPQTAFFSWTVTN